MHIEEKDSLEAYYFLQYERERGMEWMVYGNGNVTAADIFCFKTRDDMTAFRQQYDEFTKHFQEAHMGRVADAMAGILETEEGRPRARTVDVQTHLAPDITGYLERKAGEGKRWVAFQRDTVLKERDLYCSASRLEAKAGLSVLPLQHLIEALARETHGLPKHAAGIKISVDKDSFQAVYVVSQEKKSNGLLVKKDLNGSKQKQGYRIK